LGLAGKRLSVFGFGLLSVSSASSFQESRLECGPQRPPAAAERRVIELVLAGESRGGHSAAGKGGQQLRAPRRIGSFGSWLEIGFINPFYRTPGADNRGHSFSAYHDFVHRSAQARLDWQIWNATTVKGTKTDFVVWFALQVNHS
jgi:hypothetical protein